MAKKKSAKSSSPRKRGNAKTNTKRLALDNSTSEAALEAAIEKQRRSMEADELEDDPYGIDDPTDPDDLVETLLNVPNRKPLNDPGLEVLSNNKLIRFVHDKPSHYKRFLTYLREGASLGAAVFASNFCNPALVKDWLKRGMEDAEEQKDTFFSRLYMDIARSNATIRTAVEIQVAQDDPKFWLERGPGKYIDDEWKAKPLLRGIPGTGPAQQIEATEGENSLRITHKVEIEEDEVEGELAGPPIDDNGYKEALSILRASNLSPEQQSDGWMKALRIQAGETLSEDELKVEDAEESDISEGSNEEILTEQQRQAQSSLPC
jgi:hypothetical protein